MRLQVMRGPVECGPFELHDGDNFIGRSPDCEVCLPSKKVSRRHAVASLAGGRLVVKDLESHNGVVDSDGRRVAVLPIPPGGKVQIGDFLLVADAPGVELDLEEEDDLDLESGDDVDEIELEEPVPLPTRSRAEPRPPDPGATNVSPLARPSMPPPIEPARKVAVDEIRIKGLDPEPARPAARPDPNEIRIKGLDPEPPRPAAPRPPEPARAPAAERPLFKTTAPKPAPASPPRAPSAPAAEPRPPESRPAPEPRSMEARAAAEPRTMDSRPSAPRSREPEHRPAAPLPRFEPVEVPSSGVPWALQAFLLFGFLWSVIVCAPLGGLFSQKWAADDRLEAATEAFAFQVGTTLAERNAQALMDGDRTRIDLSYATSVEGVIEARVADARGMVLAPEEKYRISLGSRDVFQRASAGLSAARAPAGGSSIEIVVPARRSVNGEIVGWAFMVVDLEKLGRATSAPWWWWIPSGFVVFLVTVVLAVTPWLLFLRPLQALAAQVDRAVQGGGTVRPTARLRVLERIVFAFNGVLVQARQGRE